MTGSQAAYHEHYLSEDGADIGIFCSREGEPVTVTVPQRFCGYRPDVVMGWPTVGSCRWPLSVYVQEAVDEAEARIALRAERDGC